MKCSSGGGGGGGWLVVPRVLWLVMCLLLLLMVLMTVVVIVGLLVMMGMLLMSGWLLLLMLRHVLSPGVLNARREPGIGSCHRHTVVATQLPPPILLLPLLLSSVRRLGRRGVRSWRVRKVGGGGRWGVWGGEVKRGCEGRGVGVVVLRLEGRRLVR